MFDFPTPYLDMYRTMRFRRKPRPHIMHRATCPHCGSTLVNVYYLAARDDWMCRKCIDEEVSKKKEKENERR